MSPRTPDGREPPLTPEESRWLDSELSTEDARRLERERAADPRRSAAHDEYREAMDVWRESATRTSIDPDALGAAVLDRISRDDGSAHEEAPRFAGVYAAAAVLLICIGAAGTYLVRSRAQPAPRVACQSGRDSEGRFPGSP